ncbi:unnamed protein product [Symbiodinium sp. CCMP2592]|nr:unnamed protein product [Symbiodinium sp. CCMP2592]
MGARGKRRKGAAARLILNQNGGQGDEAQPRRGAAATLILNQNGGEEVQPPRLSSTRMGAKGKRRRGAAATLILNQNEGQGVQPPRLSGARQRGAAATLILNQNGGQGEEAQPPRLSRIGARGYSRHAYPAPGEEVQPPRLSSTRMGAGGRGAAATLILNQNRGQGGQPPRLSGAMRRGAGRHDEEGRRAYPKPIWVSEVWKLELKKDGGKDEGGGLSSTNMGFRGVEARAEEDGGKGEPGGLILNQYGFPRCGSSS